MRKTYDELKARGMSEEALKVWHNYANIVIEEVDLNTFLVRDFEEEEGNTAVGIDALEKYWMNV